MAAHPGWKGSLSLENSALRVQQCAFRMNFAHLTHMHVVSNENLEHLLKFPKRSKTKVICHNRFLKTLWRKFSGWWFVTVSSRSSTVKPKKIEPSSSEHQFRWSRIWIKIWRFVMFPRRCLILAPRAQGERGSTKTTVFRTTVFRAPGHSCLLGLFLCFLCQFSCIFCVFFAALCSVHTGQQLQKMFGTQNTHLLAILAIFLPTYWHQIHSSNSQIVSLLKAPTHTPVQHPQDALLVPVFLGRQTFLSFLSSEHGLLFNFSVYFSLSSAGKGCYKCVHAILLVWTPTNTDGAKPSADNRCSAARVVFSFLKDEITTQLVCVSCSSLWDRLFHNCFWVNLSLCLGVLQQSSNAAFLSFWVVVWVSWLRNPQESFPISYAHLYLEQLHQKNLFFMAWDWGLNCSI